LENTNGEQANRIGLFTAHRIGYSKTVAALGTAASQYFAAIFTRHAGTESMFVYALAAARLVRTLHRRLK